MRVIGVNFFWNTVYIHVSTYVFAITLLYRACYITTGLYLSSHISVGCQWLEASQFSDDEVSCYVHRTWYYIPLPIKHSSQLFSDFSNSALYLISLTNIFVKAVCQPKLPSLPFSSSLPHSLADPDSSVGGIPPFPYLPYHPSPSTLLSFPALSALTLLPPFL